MMNHRYRMAATETLDVLAHTEQDAVKKIPKKFMDLLKRNSLDDYKPVLDHSKPMYEMNKWKKQKEFLELYTDTGGHLTKKKNK